MTENMEFDEQEFGKYLCEAFEKNQTPVKLTDDMKKKFTTLARHMLEENRKYNLTAITDSQKIAYLHFADCASILPFIPQRSSVCDIGCGAGFPTLPLAIFRPDLSITAMDSTQKRVNYVESTASMLGLTNVKCLCLRAEDGAKKPELREKYDCVTARAVAELRILAEICMPYVKIGGRFLAMKGKNAKEEIAVSKKAFSEFGGNEPSLIECTLICPDETAERFIVKTKKVRKTPEKFPRAYSAIVKKPL